MNGRTRRRLQVLLMVVLTAGLLYLFLRNSDPSSVWRAIDDTNLFWLAVALVTNFLALLFRAQRWRTIISPDHPPRFYPTFFATALGFMSSALLPIRAGDVVRPALLSRRTDIRFSTAFGTVVTERVLDLFAILVIVLSFVLLALRSPGSVMPGMAPILRSAGLVALAIFVVMLGFVVSVYFFSDSVRRMHEWLGRFVPRRFHDSWMRFFDSFTGSLRVVNDGRAFLMILACTVLIWTSLTAEFYFLMLAMHHPLPYRASFLVTGVSILGLMLPTPGGVGGFHKACQIALVQFYGFDVSTSVAVALLLHLVGTAPVLLTGAALAIREGLTLGQISRIGENFEQ
ncbi:MAG: lysylphosphatidylglycerol synthase transmembrane domain-containing protein [Thermoanaerobaculia bacterium]